MGLITNRQAVLNDICNPARRSESRIIEVVPVHLAADVENGMRETARRLLGGVMMTPINKPQHDGGEAWVSMAKVMDARLQTSRNQCPGRAADMSPGAGRALSDVLKEVCGEDFPSRIAPTSSGMTPKPNAGAPACRSDWSALVSSLNTGAGNATGAAAKHSASARVEAARRLLGSLGSADSLPSGAADKEALVGMAKVISSRLQTSPIQCQGRAPDMGEGAASALIDVLKEVAGATFQRKVVKPQTQNCSIM